MKKEYLPPSSKFVSMLSDESVMITVSGSNKVTNGGLSKFGYIDPEENGILLPEVHSVWDEAELFY